MPAFLLVLSQGSRGAARGTLWRPRAAGCELVIVPCTPPSPQTVWSLVNSDFPPLPYNGHLSSTQFYSWINYGEYSYPEI